MIESSPGRPDNGFAPAASKRLFCITAFNMSFTDGITKANVILDASLVLFQWKANSYHLF